MNSCPRLMTVPFDPKYDTWPNFISQFSHTKKNAITLINTQYLLSDLDNSLPVILSSLSMTCITHLILHNKFHYKHLLQYRWIYHLQWKRFYQSVLHFPPNEYELRVWCLVLSFFNFNFAITLNLKDKVSGEWLLKFLSLTQ